MRGGNSIATTDETGTFELRDVPEGNYLVVVQHQDLVPATKRVEIREGRFENPFRILLDRGESLTGKVELSNGQPAAGAAVMVRDAAGLTKRATTDGSGRYVIRGLSKGPHSFSVRGSENLRSPTLNVTVKAGTNELDYRQEER
jgi:hypothetical protein